MSNKHNVGIIPARLNSTRFPKKILADINGKPMVIHTAEQVSKAKSLDRIIIAIDSNETYEALKNFDYEITMTSVSHKSGSDRIAEVVNNIENVGVIINIQADEPFIDPSLIDNLVLAHSETNIEMSTLVSTNISKEDYENKSIVKAFLDKNGFAVDFKRNGSSIYKHLGIYGFTKKSLLKFVSLEQTNNEKLRNLEQMRAIDNGIKIKAVLTDKDSLSINTPEDFSILTSGDRLQ